MIPKHHIGFTFIRAFVFLFVCLLNAYKTQIRHRKLFAEMTRTRMSSRSNSGHATAPVNLAHTHMCDVDIIIIVTSLPNAQVQHIQAPRLPSTIPLRSCCQPHTRAHASAPISQSRHHTHMRDTTSSDIDTASNERTARARWRRNRWRAPACECTRSR